MKKVPSNSDNDVQWSKQTLFKGWPKDCFIFHAPLFVKSTESTNIFKLGVKETGQSAPTILISKFVQLQIKRMLLCLHII